MYLVEEVIKLPTDLKESMITSDLMVDFPPISEEDPPEVRAAYVYDHYQKIGEIIHYSSIPDTMYGAPLKIASKKRKSKKASEPQPKKAKKQKAVVQVSEAVFAFPSIQEEVEDLEPVKVLEKRTRGSESVGSSGSIPAQPKIHLKKRSTVRKMKESQYVLQEEAEVEATELVTREIRNQRAAKDYALQQPLKIASEIEVPTASLAREGAGEDA